MDNIATIGIGLIVLILGFFAIRRLRTKGLCDCKECSGCCSEAGCAGCRATIKISPEAEKSAGVKKL